MKVNYATTYPRRYAANCAQCTYPNTPCWTNICERDQTNLDAICFIFRSDIGNSDSSIGFHGSSTRDSLVTFLEYSNRLGRSSLHEQWITLRKMNLELLFSRTSSWLPAAINVPWQSEHLKKISRNKKKDNVSVYSFDLPDLFTPTSLLIRFACLITCLCANTDCQFDSTFMNWILIYFKDLVKPSGFLSFKINIVLEPF